MVVNFDGSVINLRDKISAVDRKKSQSDATQKVNSSGSEKGDPSKQYIADVIGIRNENKLAVSSNSSIKTEEEAYDMLEELKKQFAADSESAVNAHKKASPDAVMQFYPFE